MKSRFSCRVKYVARVISALRSAGIQVCKGRAKGDVYVFFVHSKQEDAAVAALKSRGIEYELVQSGGVKYLKKRAAAGAGLIAAAAVTLIACIVCSLFVFDVRVSCEDKMTAALITQILQENVGKRKSEIDEEALEEEIYAQAENVSFVHLKIRGGILTANAVMQNETPEKPEERENVYALCDGVVESIAVFSGTAEVKPGDVIKRGDLLISGRRITGQDDMGNDVYEECPASGVVTARTYTGGRTRVPLSYAEKVRTGNFVTYNLLNLCGIQVGSDKGCGYEYYEREETRRKFAALLPFSLTSVTYYELSSRIVETSEADLDVIMARKQAEYLSSLQGAEILNAYKDVKKLDNYYIIDIYYEHIAPAA